MELQEFNWDAVEQVEQSTLSQSTKFCHPAGRNC
jgi:hypothetical protein